MSIWYLIPEEIFKSVQFFLNHPVYWQHFPSKRWKILYRVAEIAIHVRQHYCRYTCLTLWQTSVPFRELRHAAKLCWFILHVLR